MLQITINVNAEPERAQQIKESLAMYLEYWGDSRVVNIKHIPAQNWGAPPPPKPREEPQPRNWQAEQQRLY